ncbi:MAG: signal peptidase II [Firmicutes bacterium]|nr:signal peptidase II [Bacillota bacterium]
MALVPLILLVDQGLKFYVKTHFRPGWSVELIPGVIDLTYLRNPGAAFGLFHHRTELLILMGVLAVTLIFIYYRRLPPEKYILRYGLAFGLTGALGNLLDRLFYGYVIDMFNLSFWPGVFNVADVAIIVGIALIVIELWQDAEAVGEEAGE